MAVKFPRCQLVPLPDQQVSFQIDGAERLRWHHGPAYPRPFLYPLVGPSGAPLTRMGHPGAPDHDHHRSIWFAHEKVQGVNFWTDRTEARVRQKSWLCYQDGDDEGVMAVLLGWYDGHDPKELLEQELVVAVRPGEEGETFVELQATSRPAAESLEFGKTNFGFLAVRVAKGISAHFGGGTLTGSTGAKDEANLFGKPAEWIDYSGNVPRGTEGVTYFDHPTNPGHPASWHVREDGWMAAAPCLAAPVTTTKKAPLVLRYLLHAHRGELDAGRAKKVAKEFADRKGWVVARSKAKHQQYEATRA